MIESYDRPEAGGKMPSQSSSGLVGGYVATGFDAVRDAFEANFAEHGEVGASCAIYVDGAPKVDLWGGTTGGPDSQAWRKDTLGLVYSVTKGATAIICGLLAQHGRLDLDTPVGRYWPDFDQNGKAGTTVRMVLAHQAGLPVLEDTFPLEHLLRRGTCARALATQNPLWTAGTAFGYHALTYGWLLDEIVLRATGQTIAAHIQGMIASPLDLDFYVGLPDDQAFRVASLIDGGATETPPPGPDPKIVDRIHDAELRHDIREAASATADAASLFLRATSSNGVLPAPDATAWNDPRVRRASIPAANGITNARSVARLYAACIGEVNGARLLTANTLTDLTKTRSEGADRVTGLSSRFGTGFMLPTVGTPMLSEHSFGHEGLGGAIAFGDPAAGVAFGYVQNLLQSSVGVDRRVAGLVTALQGCLAARS
jgi:CubicO group peptidase (beta-lactamase class C family)